MSSSMNGFVLGCNKNICNWQLFTVKKYPHNERKLFDSKGYLVFQMLSVSDLPYGTDDKLFFNLIALAVKRKKKELIFKTSYDIVNETKLFSIPHNRIDESLQRIASTKINYYKWYDPKDPDKYVMKSFHLLSYRISVDENDKNRISNVQIVFDDITLSVFTKECGYWGKIELCEFNNLSTTARRLYLFLIAHVGDELFSCDFDNFGKRIGLGEYKRSRKRKEVIAKAENEIRKETKLKPWVCFTDELKKIKLCGTSDGTNCSNPW